MSMTDYIPEYFEGDQYSGQTDNKGFLHGSGVLIKSNGNRFVGEFQHGRLPIGKFYSGIDNSRYYGNFDDKIAGTWCFTSNKIQDSWCKPNDYNFTGIFNQGSYDKLTKYKSNLNPFGNVKIKPIMNDPTIELQKKSQELEEIRQQLELTQNQLYATSQQMSAKTQLSESELKKSKQREKQLLIDQQQLIKQLDLQNKDVERYREEVTSWLQDQESQHNALIEKHQKQVDEKDLKVETQKQIMEKLDKSKRDVEDQLIKLQEKMSKSQNLSQTQLSSLEEREQELLSAQDQLSEKLNKQDQLIKKYEVEAQKLQSKYNKQIGQWGEKYEILAKSEGVLLEQQKQLIEKHQNQLSERDLKVEAQKEIVSKLEKSKRDVEDQLVKIQERMNSGQNLSQSQLLSLEKRERVNY
jgi:myosin heavy subunit